MSESTFFGILSIATALGAVVIVPKLHTTKYFWLGCVLVCAFFVLFITLANPKELPVAVKLLRGVSIGVVTVLLGVLKVWLKKKYPSL